MPVSTGDRRIFILGGILVAIIFVLIGVFSGSDKNEAGFPSSYNVSRRGGKAAYLLLRQMGHNVERWEDPPDALPEQSQGILLILADPTRWPEKNESDTLHKWVATGGTLLVAETSSDVFAPSTHTKSGTYRDATTDCLPSAPTPLTRGGAIVMSGVMAWDSKHDLSQLVHYSCGDDAVVVSYAVGKGRVIWWASAGPLTNNGIREKGNLDLLLNSVTGFQRILWDEYYFTPYRGVWSYASSPALRLAMWDTLLLVAIVIFTFARRSGPLLPLISESRLSPLEFVDTLGKLYHKAGASQAVVEVAFHRFRQLLAHRMGLYGQLSAEQMNRAIETRSVGAPAELSSVLRRCEDAITDPNLTEREALRLVQGLNAGARALRLVRETLEENVDASHSRTAVAH